MNQKNPPQVLRSEMRADSVPVDEHYSAEGYFYDNPILTRTGIFKYKLEDGSERRELRRPEDVFDPASLASYEGKPIIITHDAQVIDKDNARRERVGTILTTGQQDGETVRAKIVIDDPDAVKASGLRELSVGYYQDLIMEPGEWNGEPYDAIQTNIRVNHLALVAVARAGDDKDFPELSGLKIFPQTSETDEGAAYIEYYSYEPVGFADVIANYASDLPRVDVKGTPHRAEIVNIGDSYGYNVQELRACRRNAVLGIMKSLDSARAEAARRVYDVKVNHLIWHGDEKTGIIGVLSSGNNIPIYTLQNGAAGKADWASKTADEIAADIAGILNYIDTLTQNVEHPDSWVMPNDLYTSLNLRRIDGTGESVLSYIKDHTPQIKNWEVAGELSKGNKDYNSTGKNIGLLYTKDPDKMSHDVPMAFLQHAPQDRNLEIVINCEGRDAGMMIPYPLSACLVYGL